MYNFCDDFRIEINGKVIEGIISCYRVRKEAENIVFRIGYILDEKYYEIEEQSKNIKFTRYLVG